MMILRFLFMVFVIFTSCKNKQPDSSQENTSISGNMEGVQTNETYKTLDEDTVVSNSSIISEEKATDDKLIPKKGVHVPQKKQDIQEQKATTEAKVITEDERPVKMPVKESVPASLPLPDPLENKKEEVVTSKPDFHEHQLWNEILQSHVSNVGIVDYKAIKSDQRFNSYLKELASHVPDATWTNRQKLAYWINAYNAFTIKKVVENLPIKSITDLEGGKTWDVKWIKIGDKTYSLNNIENDILRPIFKEPRIHFAINCAAKSCPPLSNSAFTPENVLIKLEKQTKAFINNKNYNTISAKEAKISKIFDWYAADFDDLQSFINQYSNIKTTSKPLFMDYDWSLNDH